MNKIKSKNSINETLDALYNIHYTNKKLKTICKKIKKDFFYLLYKENENRLFLKIDGTLIVIAKNQLGNKYNYHEYDCSNYFREYPIDYRAFNVYPFYHHYHLIIKPFIEKIDYKSNSKIKELFYRYSSSFYNKAITKNFNPKMIGLYNNKLVLRSYLNIFPFNNIIQCHNCGQPIYTYLEPYCPYCHATNFDNNNFINNLFKSNKGVC